MTKVAYLECPTGLSGDMCLGALVHAGVPLDYLTSQLERLGIGQEYQLWTEQVLRNGQQATKVHVDLLHYPAGSPDQTFTAHTHTPAIAHSHPPHPDGHSHPHPDPHPTGSADLSAPPPQSLGSSATAPHAPHAHAHARHLPEIEQLIRSAHLPPRVEAWSLTIFHQLAIAEGAVHGIAPEQVHFHEVGATDAIVDIIGTCLGLDWLGIDQLYCSPLPTGGGTIRAAHGLLPVPTPAVLKLWEMRQVPIYSNGILKELVTPTGAAIATTLAAAFGPPPAMVLHRVGLGAGSRDLPIPNILRLWIGTADDPMPMVKTQVNQRDRQAGDGPLTSLQAPIPTELSQETVAVLETQIDDLNSQAFGYLFDRMLAAGALDLFTQAIGMKKSRPGVLLTVICRPEQQAQCEAILFQETTTLGVRRSLQHRSALHREFQGVATPYGPVTVKVARYTPNGAIANIQPEYEDCAAIARQYNLPWIEIYRTALHQGYEQISGSAQQG